MQNFWSSSLLGATVFCHLHDGYLLFFGYGLIIFNMQHYINVIEFIVSLALLKNS